MYERIHTDRGFSLPELMTVLVVIAILVMIAIPVYNASTGRAGRISCLSNQRILTGAIETYRADNDAQDPADVDALLTYVTGDATPTCPADNSDGYVLLPDGSQVVCENDDHNE